MPTGSTVLVVKGGEDPRGALALALRSNGEHVLEAADGAEALRLAATELPEVVVVSAALRDMTGAQLVERLRALPALAGVPVVGVSSFGSGDDLRFLTAGVSSIVVRPVDADLFVATVRGLAPGARPRTAAAPGRLVVAADPDPDRLEHLRGRLAAHGLRVRSAPDGIRALELARDQRPDAIVAEVAMPGLDGLALCSAVRRDAELARTPVILITSGPVDERWVGASACAQRTPDLEEVLAALDLHLPPRDEDPTRAWTADLPAVLRPESAHRAARQLERQASVTVGLVKRCALQGASLSVLGGIAEALARREDVDASLEPILARCLDAGGLTLGELHLVSPGGELELRARVPGGGRSAAAPDELARLLLAEGPTPIPLQGVRAAIGVPLLDRDERTGVLLLGSSAELGADGPAFARTLASQLALAVALTRAFGRLSSSELRHRALMEHANDAIFVLDLQGRVLDANCQAEASLRRTRAQLGGGPWTELLAPASQPAARAAVQAAIDTGMARADALLLDAPGEPRAVDGSLALVDTGRERVVLVIARDVTERLRAQQSLARTAERLLQSQKMEAVGRLAGGIAHDFNNLLTAILGYAEVLHAGARDGATRSVVEEVQKAGMRAAALTRQLLSISRKQDVRPRALDLNAVVSDMDRLLRRVLSANVELTTRLAPDLWPLVADPSQLEQVILNLAVNARDAMPRGGTLTLETRNARVLGEGDDQPPIPPGEYVLLQVADTGFGMPPDVLARAFEPFFTTKPQGEGTGLGLSTVYGVVRQAGGYVLASSEVGRGTTLRCWWPRAASPVAAPAQVTPPAPPAGGDETILVVDDDDLVLRLAERTLAGHGYRVLVARESAAALTHVAATRIDLLVTDLLMPGVGGHELARLVQGASLGTRVLYLSGYDSAAMKTGDPREEAGAFLRKPFGASTLARAVRDVLDAGPSGAQFSR